MKVRTCINRSIVNKTEDKKALTNKNVIEELSPLELLTEITKGHSFCIAELKESDDGYCHRCDDNFVQSSLIAIDIDNTKTDSKNRQLTVNEGYRTFEDFSEDPLITSMSSFIYTTYHHTDDWNRFRCVFVLEQPITDQAKLQKLITKLIQLFNGDKSSKSITQNFYGSTGAKYKIFDNVLSAETVEEYLDDDVNSNNNIEISNDSNQKGISKEEIDKMLGYIFKSGYIENSKWFTVITILKNLGLYSDDEIVSLVGKYVSDVGDIKIKMKYAYRYPTLKIGTLIYLAKQNGYVLTEFISSPMKQTKFWNTTIKKSKVGDKEELEVKILNSQLSYFLKDFGFGILTNNDEMQLIRITDKNQIEISNNDKAWYFLTAYVNDNVSLFKDSREKDMVREELFRNYIKIHSSIVGLVDRVEEAVDSKLIMDNPEQSYIYYENIVKIISKENQTLVDYSKLDGLVWKNSILDRNYYESDHKMSEYEQFIRNVCSSRLPDDTIVFNEDKFNSMKSIIGYMLHRYKNPAEAYAVILCDENLSSAAMGGTGKSIFSKALGKIRNSVRMDGKKFESSTFCFQNVDNSTEIINMDDCSHKFKFEDFYSNITCNLEIERKYKSKIIIDEKKSPKFIFSTNHVFEGNGDSDKRRRWEIEFSNYYSINFKPDEDFGHNLVDDSWDNKEYNRFDDFMADCIQYYLQNGRINYSLVNLEYKKFVDQTSETFAEYCKNNIKLDTPYLSSDILEDLKENYFEEISSYMLTKYFRSWGEYIKCPPLEGFDFHRKVFIFSSDKRISFHEWKRKSIYKEFASPINSRLPSEQSTNSNDFFDD